MVGLSYHLLPRFFSVPLFWSQDICISVISWIRSQALLWDSYFLLQHTAGSLLLSAVRLHHGQFAGLSIRCERRGRLSPQRAGLEDVKFYKEAGSGGVPTEKWWDPVQWDPPLKASLIITS